MKPPSGQNRCHRGCACGLDFCTGCTQVKLGAADEQERLDPLSEVPLTCLIPVPVPGPVSPPVPASCRQIHRCPIPFPDKRPIVWGIQRWAPHTLPALPPPLTEETATSQMEVEAHLQETKLAAIKSIGCHLHGASATGTSSHGVCCGNASLLIWLHTLPALTVLALHNNFRDKLLHCNGWVVTFNPALASFATGSSTNAAFPGNTQQSASALFCVVPHAGKDRVSLTSC